MHLGTLLRARDTPELLDGRFELVEEAGSGGMGVVYRAIDRERGVMVAVKIVDADHGERFRREIAVIAELSHPGIVGFVAQGETPHGEPYLALEWLDGESLGRRLERGPLTVEETLILGLRVAEVLAHLHARGVRHRDLKPSNLFLCGGDVSHIKLIDFGVARVVGADDLTKRGQIVGTPGYMAPEQARGRREADERSDLFSLGCVLYHCLTGTPPFVGDDVLSVLTKLAIDDPPSARRFAAVPDALSRLVTELLAKDAERRPGSAMLVQEALAVLLEGTDSQLVSTLRTSSPPEPPRTEASPALVEPTSPVDDVAPPTLPCHVPTVEATSPDLKRTRSEIHHGAPHTVRSASVPARPRWWLPLGVLLLTVTAAGAWWLTAKNAPASLVGSEGQSGLPPALAPPHWQHAIGGEGTQRTVALAVHDVRVFAAVTIPGATPPRVEDGVATTGDAAVVTAFGDRGQPTWQRRFDGAGGITPLAIASAPSEVTMGGFFHEWIHSDDGHRVEGRGRDSLFIAVVDAARGATNRLTAHGEEDLDLFLGKLALATSGEGRLHLAGGYGGTLDLGCGPRRAAGPVAAFVAQLETGGACAWMHVFGDDGLQTFESVGVDIAGRITVAGEMQGSMAIGDRAHESRGGIDIVVAQLDKHGTPRWSHTLGGHSGKQGSLRVAVHPLGAVLVAGWFEGPLALEGQEIAASHGEGHDLIVLKLDAGGALLWTRVVEVERARCPAMSCNLDRIGLAADSEGGATVAFPFAGRLSLGMTGLSSRGGTDMAVVRWDDAGSLVGALQLGDAGPQCPMPFCVLEAAANQHAVVIGGGFEGALAPGVEATDVDAFVWALPP